MKSTSIALTGSSAAREASGDDSERQAFSRSPSCARPRQACFGRSASASLVFNDRLAEIGAPCLRKGSQTYVVGRIRTRKQTGKDGVEKYAADVRVDQMQMPGSRHGQGVRSGHRRHGRRRAVCSRQAPNPNLFIAAPRPWADAA
jgi:single-stranded DNA-binding protein